MTTPTPHGAPELLACPFCGRETPDDLSDTLYPSGGYWRETDGMRHYISHRVRKPGDSQCWTMHCGTGGWRCGAQITADSREEAITAWNRRAAIQQAAGAVPEGHRIVPIEPTQEMLNGGGQRIAMNEQYVGSAESKAGFVWRDMLAAALNIKLPGQFYPGMTATESEFANDLYYGRERKTAMLAASPTPPASGGSSDHLVPCAGGGVTQWQPIETVPAHCAVLIFTRNRGIKIERAEYVRQLIEDAKLSGEDCFYTHWMHLPDDAPAPRPDAPTSQINPGSAPREDGHG